jgi:hypothetical protein
MMILTDKAKNNFLEYYWENYIGKSRCLSKKDETEDFFNSLITPLKFTLITEWLDGIEMFFWVYRAESGYWATSIERKAKFDNRNDALIDGIEIVNYIYNATKP